MAPALAHDALAGTALIGEQAISAVGGALTIAADACVVATAAAAITGCFAGLAILGATRRAAGVVVALLITAVRRLLAVLAIGRAVHRAGAALAFA